MRSLLISFETLHVLVWAVLVYGLLFVSDPGWLFCCIFFAVVVITLGQLTNEYLLDHLTSTLDPLSDKTSQKTRVEGCAGALAVPLGVRETTVSLVLRIMIHFTLLLGFYRLYAVLSQRKGFI